MTDIAVFTQPFAAEDLSWNLTPRWGGFVAQGTIDVTKFNAAQTYPNGYIPSGAILGVVTAGGLLAPYLDAAVDGTQTAVGILAASVQVLQPTGVAKAKVGVAYMVHGIISQARLPFTVGNQALGGYIDANGRTDLKLIYFAA
jgi:hypothetical protein